MNNATLYAQWIELKAAEAEAKEKRQKVEDLLLKAWGVSNTVKGTKTFSEYNYKVKVTFRQNQKVDVAALKELATEAGLTEHIDALFRWEAEVNKKNWSNSAESITGPLSKAITTKPGRPSFAVEVEEQTK